MHAAALAVVVTSAAFAATGVAFGGSTSTEASPIYGVTIPEGYRKWELIAPAQEAAPLNELRAVLGNDVAMKAYRDGTLPFPDGTVLAKLAWKHVQSPEFQTASIPGAATTVQFMVKDSKNMPQPVAGDLVDSSMASLPMRRSIRPAMHAIWL